MSSLVKKNINYVGNDYNKRIKENITLSLFCLVLHFFAKRRNRAAFILNFYFNKFETDTCLLISWNNSPVLIVLQAFLNEM